MPSFNFFDKGILYLNNTNAIYGGKFSPQIRCSSCSYGRYVLRRTPFCNLKFARPKFCDLKWRKATPIFEQVFVRRTQIYLPYFKDDELKIAEKAHFRRFVLF